MAANFAKLRSCCGGADKSTSARQNPDSLDADQCAHHLFDTTLFCFKRVE
jgi:hypothetical protein